MIVPYYTHSQNTSKITITREQLRTANLIFAEHKQYDSIIPLLQQENNNLLMINDIWKHTDSLKTIQIQNIQEIVTQQESEITQLKSRVKYTWIFSSSITCAIITTLWAILK